MKFEYILTEAKFICSIDEFCFQEILDDLNEVEYINILTYNITTENSKLINKLFDVTKDSNILLRIITNIPDRWDTYFDEIRKNKAFKSIEKYIIWLDPQKFNEISSVHFNFKNHSKIIMTNKIIYWGSANFSDTSKINYECGTISRDKEFITYMSETVFKFMMKQSINYYQIQSYIKDITDFLNTCTILDHLELEETNNYNQLVMLRKEIGAFQNKIQQQNDIMLSTMVDNCIKQLQGPLDKMIETLKNHLIFEEYTIKSLCSESSAEKCNIGFEASCELPDTVEFNPYGPNPYDTNSIEFTSQYNLVKRELNKFNEELTSYSNKKLTINNTGL